MRYGFFAVSSVRMKPGETVTTVTPAFAISTRRLSQ